MSLLLYTILSLYIILTFSKLAERECEVCIKVLNELSSTGLKKVSELDTSLRKSCKAYTNTVEGRFCYYIGAMPDSATSIVQEALKPLSFGKPVEKICEDLKKKDSSICTLRFEKPIDLTVDLNKLKMSDLRKAISENKLDCSQCTEKSDYVRLLTNFRDSKAGGAKKDL